MNKNIFTQDKWNVGVTYIPEKFIHMRYVDYNNDLHTLNYSKSSYNRGYSNLTVYNLHEQDIETTIELNVQKIIESYNKMFNSVRPIFACRKKPDKYSSDLPYFILFSHEDEDDLGDYYADYDFTGKVDYIVRFKRGVYLYEYARYEFFERIQKYDKEIAEVQKLESLKKKSTFGLFKHRKLKSEQLMDKRDDAIDYYLNEYFEWFDKQFITLKIPSHYLETLKKATYIGLKFDIRKPVGTPASFPFFWDKS